MGLFQRILRRQRHPKTETHSWNLTNCNEWSKRAETTASSHWAGAVHPHLFPVIQEFREQSQEQSRTLKRACSKHPQDWPFSCGTQSMFSHPLVTKTQGQWSQKTKKRFRVVVEGKERKLNHVTLEATAKGKTMGQNAGEANFLYQCPLRGGREGNADFPAAWQVLAPASVPLPNFHK